MNQKPKEKNKGGRPLKLKPETVKEVVDGYLVECEKNKKVPFMIELARLLGIDKDNLTDYSRRPHFAEHIKRVKEASETALLRKVVDDNKPVGGIFLLKSMFQYVEQQKVDLTSNGQTLGVVQLPGKAHS